MNHSLLPTRGIFVPIQMIFNTQLPSVVLLTWIQLRCLAWRGWDTPPMSIPELGSLIGIHPARLNRHLSQLQDISALTSRTAENGKLILSFPAEPSIKAENQAADTKLSGSPSLHSSGRESPESGSYFPAQIMGYLTFREDQNGLDDPIEIEELIIERENAEKCV